MKEQVKEILCLFLIIYEKFVQINKDSIIVFIPYNRVSSFSDLVDKVVDKLVDKLNKIKLNFHQ